MNFFDIKRALKPTRTHLSTYSIETFTKHQESHNRLRNLEKFENSQFIVNFSEQTKTTLFSHLRTL